MAVLSEIVKPEAVVIGQLPVSVMRKEVKGARRVGKLSILASISVVKVFILFCHI